MFASVHPPSAPMSCEHSAPRYMAEMSPRSPRETPIAPHHVRLQHSVRNLGEYLGYIRRARACSRRMLVPSRPHKLSIVDES